MDIAIFSVGAAVAVLPVIFMLPDAIKESKGGEPAVTYIKDENGIVIGKEDTTTLPKPIFKTEMGKWYAFVQIVCGGVGIAMMIDAFS